MWEIVLYRTPSGTCPVADFVAGLDPKTQAKIARDSIYWKSTVLPSGCPTSGPCRTPAACGSYASRSAARPAALLY
ncbi:MAG: hypothetical protein RDV00_09745 [Clostridia bacterium]|nr:hypothetical protein [Clostridia bacterium]MDQ7792385.1 hypothetical protein [Clostridia bacterium]